MGYNSRRRRKQPNGGPPPLNFVNWLLIMISIGNLVLSSLIVFMGVQAMDYDFGGIMIIDRALIALGVMVFIISVVAIIGVARESDLLLLYVMYSSIIEFILLCVFAVGAFVF